MKTLLIFAIAASVPSCKSACTAKRATKTICSQDAGVTTCIYECKGQYGEEHSR